jgi:hypothetical protein
VLDKVSLYFRSDPADWLFDEDIDTRIACTWGLAGSDSTGGDARGSSAGKAQKVSTTRDHSIILLFETGSGELI